MKKKNRTLLIAVPITVIVLVSSFAIGFFWSERLTSDVFESDQVEEEMKIGTDQSSETDEIEEDEEIVLDQSDVGVGEIAVDWIAVEDQKIGDALTLFEDAFAYYDQYGVRAEYNPAWTAINLGEILDGPYVGLDLTLQMSEEDGLGTFYQFYYVAVDPNGIELPVLFDNYYAPQSSVFTRPEMFGYASEKAYWTEEEKERLVGRLLIDTTTVITDITSEDFVTAGKVPLVFAGVSGHVLFPGDVNKVGTGNSIGTLADGTEIFAIIDDFGATTDLFRAVGKDGRISIYDIDIPFWHTAELVKTPYLVWSDGTTNEQEYRKSESLGCGYRSTNVRDDVSLADLVVAGSFLGADGKTGSVYQYKNWDKDALESEFNIWMNRTDIDDWDQFVESRPIFFYQDELDRIIMFRSSLIDGGAECGKPVIYLYPEVETDLEVKLELEGGFSITEPEYKDGWRVTARPDGTLTNLEDGVEYPYLFWEGNGGIYVPPSNYWVVAKDEVPSFLVEILAELGLNAQETADFMEFWAPRMEAAPWYKIGFHGTQVMNLIAPLQISKNPDTLLRILMDYEELEAPIAENPLTLPPTPHRSGFTVIEWGGVLK